MRGQTLGAYRDLTDVALFKEQCEWVQAKADDDVVSVGGDDGPSGSGDSDADLDGDAAQVRAAAEAVEGAQASASPL